MASAAPVGMSTPARAGAPGELELPTFKGRPGWEFTDISGLDLAAYERVGGEADGAAGADGVAGADGAAGPAPVSPKRRRWKTYQGRIAASRLVFLDESGAKTNLTRLRGRAPRHQRLHAAAPAGRYNQFGI